MAVVAVACLAGLVYWRAPDSWFAWLLVPMAIGAILNAWRER